MVGRIDLEIEMETFETNAEHLPVSEEFKIRFKVL